MLTAKESADYLGVSLDHMRRLLRSGAVQSVDVGNGRGRRTYRIRQTELDRFIAERKVVGRVSDERVKAWRKKAITSAS